LVLSEHNLEVGKVKWSNVASQIPQRNGKQCRERWFNHLRPDIKKGGWTEDEDKAIVEHYIKIRWTMIANILRRADNDVKNHWNSKEFIATRRRLSGICSPLCAMTKMNDSLKAEMETTLDEDIKAVEKSLNLPKKRRFYVFDEAIKTEEESTVPDKEGVNNEDFEERARYLTQPNFQLSPICDISKAMPAKRENLTLCNSLINSASMFYNCDSDVTQTPKAVYFGDRAYFSPKVLPTETLHSDYCEMSTPFDSTECCEQVAV